MDVIHCHMYVVQAKRESLVAVNWL